MSENNIFSLDYHRLRRMKRTLKKINALKDDYRSLSDEALQAKTEEFKERLATGESLDDILVEAFATIREADYRVLGMFPYDVQVLGAIVLHGGNVAEMKTGEGKTLTANMALYLNALTGKGAMLVTTSSYLALRDAREMGKVYRFLGLTVSTGVHEDPKYRFSTIEKRQIYAADIIYTTNGALGFDYLIENLADTEDKQYLRPYNYVIVDEADAVLLDIALTPLIISGAPRLQSNLYQISEQFISTLEEGIGYHYDPERKEVWLTQEGISEAEHFFALKQFHSEDRFELVRHVTLALKAELLYENGKDYVIENEEIKLLDKQNGRILEGTKLQGGQHQAIEAKEGIKLSEEMRAMASITYQNLFLMFPKIAGMTGTAKTAEAEFIDVYNMEVICVPTNAPVIRKDYPDKIYTSLPEKIRASLELVKEIHATGQPILLVTGSVTMSQLYSELLLLEAIPHSLLNAHNAAKEAEMIAEAGQLGSVTVATNMAGRGTDIKLGDGVVERGGLAVIATERMQSARMDLQVRGRSGRQGDPGFSQFFVSLEDNLIVEHGPKWVHQYFERRKHKVSEDYPRPLRRLKFRNMIEEAQEASDSQGKSARRQTLDFDASVKIQRDYIYNERQAIIHQKDSNFSIHQVIEEVIEQFIEDEPNLDYFTLNRYIFDNLSYSFSGVPDDLNLDNLDDVRHLLYDLIDEELKKKENFLKVDFQHFERTAVIKAIDEAWIEEVDYLQQLRTVVSSRQLAQRNPVYEYHEEALLAYDKMKDEIKKMILRYLMLSEVSYTDEGKLSIYFA